MEDDVYYHHFRVHPAIINLSKDDKFPYRDSIVQDETWASLYYHRPRWLPEFQDLEECLKTADAVRYWD